MKSPQRVKSATGQWTLGLFDPGMTDLHRTGLAGLAMTLLAWDQEGKTIAGGRWELGPRSVTLTWDDPAFLTRIITDGLAVDAAGLVAFPGLGPTAPESVRVHTQNGLMGTFLQHGQSRTVGEPVVRSHDIDGVTDVVTFRPLLALKAHRTVSDPTAATELNVHLYPGAGQRHAGVSESELRDSPGRALLLRFALVGAVLYRAGVASGGTRIEWCLVLPHVTNLKGYANRRLRLGATARELQVAGSAEAVFRFCVSLDLVKESRLQDVTGCTVIAFGQRAWNPKQQIRLENLDSRVPSPPALALYQRLSEASPPRRIQWADRKTKEPRSGYVATPVVQFACANLLAGRPTHSGLSTWWAAQRQAADPKKVHSVLAYPSDKEALRVMTQALDSPEATFVAACQEAWRRRAGALAEQGDDFSRRYSNGFEAARIAFARCKTPELFRATVTDFWARSGSLPSLQNNWQGILPFLGPRWIEGRDLALLALASYKGKGADEPLTTTEHLEELPA